MNNKYLYLCLLGRTNDNNKKLMTDVSLSMAKLYLLQKGQRVSKGRYGHHDSQAKYMTLHIPSCTRTACAMAAGERGSSLCWLVELPSPLMKGSREEHREGKNVYV